MGAALEGKDMVVSERRASDLPEREDVGRLGFSAPDAATAGTETLPAAGPAAQYKHDHPPIRNANDAYGEKLGLGQGVAERLTATVGGWPFHRRPTAGRLRTQGDGYAHNPRILRRERCAGK
jgi:hypothetical protein